MMISDCDHLIYNARIFTADPLQPVITSGSVGIVGTQIAWVSDMPPTRQMMESARRVHDVRGGWVTPGLIDCHTHLVFAGHRASEFEARVLGKTYLEIAQAGGGIASTVRATRATDFEALKDRAQHYLKVMLKQGVTGIEIKSGYGLDRLTERRILEVAHALGRQYPVSVYKTFLGAHRLPDEYRGNPKGYIQDVCMRVLPELAAAGLVDAVDGFCEGIGFSAVELRPLFECAQQLGLKIKCHAEQLSLFGGTDLICDLHGVSCDHLEYADERLVQRMQVRGVTAVVLPGAFYCLRETQKPPIELFRRYGVPMALATDFNPGTSPILSIHSVMNMACLLWGFSVEEAWYGVTTHAARALGVADQVGMLRSGYAADLIIWHGLDALAEVCYWIGQAYDLTVFKSGVCGVGIEGLKNPP
jgi:imidazolonepropionase